MRFKQILINEVAIRQMRLERIRECSSAFLSPEQRELAIADATDDYNRAARRVRNKAPNAPNTIPDTPATPHPSRRIKLSRDRKGL
jgi:hypothetical protein